MNIAGGGEAWCLQTLDVQPVVFVVMCGGPSTLGVVLIRTGVFKPSTV